MVVALPLLRHTFQICRTVVFQFTSVTQSCPTLWDPMVCSMPDLPVYHQHPQFTQTHAHWVSDAIQPSHPLSPPSPPAFNLSRHQGLFQWVSSLHQVVKVLEFQLQQFLPMNTQDWSPLGWTDWISKGLSRVFFQHHNSKASILQPSAFFIVQISHPYITTGKAIALIIWTFVSKIMSAF